VAASARPVAVARRAMAIDDILRWKIAGPPALSPDGTRIVCPLTIVEETANGYQTHLWIVPAGSTAGSSAKGPQPLTTARARDTAPRWSPDGRRIAFVSDRSGPKQVWVIHADGGEARLVTPGSYAPADLAWSPDGKMLAFTGKPDAGAAGRREPREQSDVRVISRLYYKQDGEGFWDGRWKQIFVVPAAGGEVRQLTGGEYDHTAPAWSPDGRWLAYCANDSPDADLEDAADLWIIRTDGTGAPRRLTRPPGQVETPAWSPDGTRIAYVGHDNECAGEATLPRVWVAAVDGGEPACLTRGYDGSVGHHIGSDARSQPGSGGVTWAPDGGRIYFLTTERGRCQVASVAVTGGAIRLETSGDHDLIGCSLDAAARRVASVECDPVTPGEVAVADLQDGRPATFHPLSTWNDAIAGGLSLVRPEPFEYKTPDGFIVDGWVMKPPDAVASGGRTPGVLEIHGGPHGAYGYAFSNQFQLLCAAGYGVVYTNPRGSHGAGQAFLAGTRHDWGGGDYRDLMGALDRALTLHPWIDPDRLGVCGGSYGGYMTNWIIGHTDRFRAAVTLRSTCNRYSHWGTGDIAHRHARWEWPGAPWESPDFYLERSPIAYVRRIRTPVLIMHGENDLRCSIEQAEQLFVALKRLGTATLFVRFPGESHSMSSSGQPRHRTEEMRHLLGWFKKYLGAAGTDATPGSTPAAEGVPGESPRPGADARLQGSTAPASDGAGPKSRR
jgi:dipeptidyl aminopeptidase/acylaminoacyl peptidase